MVTRGRLKLSLLRRVVLIHVNLHLVGIHSDTVDVLGMINGRWVVCIIHGWRGSIKQLTLRFLAVVSHRGLQSCVAGISETIASSLPEGSKMDILRRVGLPVFFHGTWFLLMLDTLLVLHIFLELIKSFNSLCTLDQWPLALVLFVIQIDSASVGWTTAWSSIQIHFLVRFHSDNPIFTYR